jgi:hypothetical protein
MHRCDRRCREWECISRDDWENHLWPFPKDHEETQFHVFGGESHVVTRDPAESRIYVCRRDQVRSDGWKKRVLSVRKYLISVKSSELDLEVDSMDDAIGIDCFVVIHASGWEAKCAMREEMWDGWRDDHRPIRVIHVVLDIYTNYINRLCLFTHLFSL